MNIRGAKVTKGVLLAVGVSLALPVAVAGQARTPDEQRRRNQIQLMEGVLVQAVRIGGEQVGRRMQALDPTMAVLIGQARARGFVLEGYGVFFDVEVPTLRQSVAWSVLNMQRDSQVASALDVLRRYLELAPDVSPKEGPSRAQVQQALKQVAQQVGPVQSNRNMQEKSAPPAPGTVVAADAANVDVIDDPNTQYTEAVKNALIDAMLDHSLPMDLGADEWLTVAARDNEGPLTPNAIDDAMTIVLRVKGSDLAAFAADRTKRAEFRQKVQVRVF